jgi:hypothetical protein
MTPAASSQPAKAAQYAAALARCRGPLLEYCGQRIVMLLDQASEALLDFAERAESNTVQGRFFEAMSHINHGRNALVRTFLEGVARGFTALGDAAAVPQAQGPAGTTAVAELSLIAPDDMEESVACENIIIKANANCFPELYALSQRLAVISDGKKIKDYEIVGGPHQLVHAMRAAMRPLEVDVKVKLVLYALFDRVLMRDVQSIYHQMNELLRDDGVLPHIKPVSVKKAREREIRERAEQEERGGARDAGDGRAEDNTSLGGELFDDIIELMARRRPVGKPAGPAEAPVTRSQVISAFDTLPRERNARRRCRASAAAARCSSTSTSSDASRRRWRTSASRCSTPWTATSWRRWTRGSSISSACCSSTC